MIYSLEKGELGFCSDSLHFQLLYFVESRIFFVHSGDEIQIDDTSWESLHVHVDPPMIGKESALAGIWYPMYSPSLAHAYGKPPPTTTGLQRRASRAMQEIYGRDFSLVNVGRRDRVAWSSSARSFLATLRYSTHAGVKISGAVAVVSDLLHTTTKCNSQLAIPEACCKGGWGGYLTERSSASDCGPISYIPASVFAQQFPPLARASLKLLI